MWDCRQEKQNFDFYGSYNLHIICDIYFPLSDIRVDNPMNASVIKVIPQCCIKLRIISRGIVVVPNIMQLFEMCDKNIWYGAHSRVITHQRRVKNPCSGTH